MRVVRPTPGLGHWSTSSSHATLQGFGWQYEEHGAHEGCVIWSPASGLSRELRGSEVSFAVLIVELHDPTSVEDAMSNNTIKRLLLAVVITISSGAYADNSKDAAAEARTERDNAAHARDTGDVGGAKSAADKAEKAADRATTAEAHQDARDARDAARDAEAKHSK